MMRALERAAEQAGARLGSRVPRTFLIELHAPQVSGQRVDLDWALDHLYLDADHCYRIIDTAVTQILPDASVAFMRASGHVPVPFDQTWDPPTFGPFKLVRVEQVTDLRAHSG
jgi:hypothetical protein